MSDRHGDRDLTASIRELAATLERGLRDHPAPEELRSFVAGDLPADREEWLEEHLALCRECAQKTVELAEVPEIGTGRRGELLSEAEIDAQWKRFQATVKPPRWRRAAGALAAVLLVAVVGFSAWAVRLSQQAQPSEIRNPYVIDLDPLPRKRGEPGEVEQQRAQVPGWAKETTLNLYLAGIELHDKYNVEIKTADGHPVLNLSGFRPGNNEAIAVDVPRNKLPPGEYRIRLLSPQGKEVAVYELLFEP